MTNDLSSPTVTFLLRLSKIDKSGLTVRDVIVLYAVMSKPGINGNDVTKMIGHEDRSGLQAGFERLMRHGLIEDRRERWGKAVPTIFHALPAGVKFWEDLVS